MMGKKSRTDENTKLQFVKKYPSIFMRERLKKVERNASLRKCVCFLFNFLVVANKLGVFSLCVLCVVLIFECILLQCDLPKISYHFFFDFFFLEL